MAQVNTTAVRHHAVTFTHHDQIWAGIHNLAWKVWQSGWRLGEAIDWDTCSLPRTV
jgi:hypothetical protein